MPLPVPADEFPIHQAPLSLRYVPASDRNFYDRSYLNAHDRSGEIFLITGMGVYPNLGVVDAFVTVRRGDRLWVVRCSDALEERGLDLRVGPYRIEVLDPLRSLRVVCDADDQGVSVDLTWEGSFPAVLESPHVMRSGTRAILDASRFAQVGSWSGMIRVDGEEIPVDPSVWMGTRDRSWGIRPVGEPEPPGRSAAEPLEGFWWTYVPLRFEDFALIVIVQEQPDGYRILNDATRVFADGRVEQLGWPRVRIDYRPGSRHPEAAVIDLCLPDGTPARLEVDTLGFVPLNAGAGYGGDPDWAHGSWRGRKWIEGQVADLASPEISARIPFGVVDHVARARLTVSGEGVLEGWGMFEHATFGRHDPSGFADWGSVAG